MARKVKLKTIRQNDNATLYSIHFESDSRSEYEKFMEKFKDNAELRIDYLTIIYAIDKMMNGNGFLERKFRPEGKMADDVVALPIVKGKLRLYCLRLSDGILIAGNGGIKDKDIRRYQDSEELLGYVVDLQAFDEIIKDACEKGIISIEETEITNTDNLNFEL